MKFFWKTYGRATHDLVVHENARGGVWIAGGIIRKDYAGGNDQYKEKVKDWFMTEFTSGPTHRSWVNKTPLHVITDKRAGLEGCIEVGSNPEYFERERQN